jgi:hypothetical protein
MCVARSDRFRRANHGGSRHVMVVASGAATLLGRIRSRSISDLIGTSPDAQKPHPETARVFSVADRTQPPQSYGRKVPEVDLRILVKITRREVRAGGTNPPATFLAMERLDSLARRSWETVD